MPLTLLESDNADLDLTSQVTALDTGGAVHGTEHKQCQVVVLLGDGVKDLDGNGGNFELEVIIGGNSWNGGPQFVVLGPQTRTLLVSDVFPVPATLDVVGKVKSPNAADSDVDVTAQLYEVNGMAALAGAMLDALLAEHTDAGSAGAALRDLHDRLFGKHEQNQVTGVHTFYRGDGVTTLATRQMTTFIAGDGNPATRWDEP